MASEHLPKEERAEEMEIQSQEGIAREQHSRLRAVFERAVAKQAEYFPDPSDWLIQCCDSLEAFVRCFPDRERFEEQLQELEEAAQSFAEGISAQTERIQQEGRLNYFDLEALRYDLPPRETFGEIDGQ